MKSSVKICWSVRTPRCPRESAVLCVPIHHGISTPPSVEEERGKKENLEQCHLFQAYEAALDQPDLQAHKVHEENEDQREDLVLVVLKGLMGNLVSLASLVTLVLQGIPLTQDQME